MTHKILSAGYPRYVQYIAGISLGTRLCLATFVCMHVRWKPPEVGKGIIIALKGEMVVATIACSQSIYDVAMIH